MIADGDAVPDAAIADSIVIECKIVNFEKAGSSMAHPGKLAAKIDVYLRKDHAAVTSISPEVKLMPGYYHDDDVFGKSLGTWMAGEISKALK